MTQPCKNCPDRALHCHGKCEKYARFQAECAAANAKRREAREERDTIYAEMRHMAAALKKGKKGR